MKKYRVGFKWSDGEEDYITLNSSKSSSEIVEEFKKSDKTGKLEVVYVKLINHE